MAGLEGFLIAPDPVAELSPEALPVVPPAQLIDQLLAGLPLLGAGKDRIPHFRQADRSMADVGREPGNGATEKVAGFRIALRLDLAQQGLRLAPAPWDRAQAATGLRKELLQCALELAAV